MHTNNQMVKTEDQKKKMLKVNLNIEFSIKSKLFFLLAFNKCINHICTL